MAEERPDEQCQETRYSPRSNPNSGKTTIFNNLTGARQHVGNYPGVTVEQKSGTCYVEGRELEIVDLPGTYILTAYSPKELVATKVKSKFLEAIKVAKTAAAN
jgi:Fe2+ transport system protein B